ncbi:PTS transporter subunit EIIC [Clostridium thermobutyricum]|uniref:PTS sugar transporter subunit IIC n=1 Tax=Clostridium thermobutyricum TaxID=29372 RepID=UPI0029421429|nr:PTS transporter subunit EIIC [Clostridium thermobutyricum]
MKKFIAFMEKYVVPVAAKIGAEPHMAAIRDGFVTIIPLIMIGAVGILVNNITDAHWYVGFMSGIFGAGWKGWGGNVWNASYAIMSLVVCFTISYHLTRSRGKDGLAVAVVAVGVFILFIYDLAKGTTFLGTDGLLLAIVIALIVSDIMCLLLGNPKLLIKMPDGVPPAVSRSFASLFPTMIVVGGAGILQEIYLMFHTGMVLPALFNKLIQTPLQGVVSSFWGVLVLIFVIQLLWFFGLHGSNMMLPIVQGVLFPLTIDNMKAIEMGHKAKYIINDQFLNSFCNMGGSGLTICLIIAIFIVHKKSSDQQKMIAKLGIAPGVFNINEPVIFGLPICLDPIYIIPFMGAPLLNAVITYFAMSGGLVPYPTVEIFWTIPPVLSGILGTRSWQGGVLAIILLIIDVLIYIPFVIVAADRDKKTQQEAEAKMQEEMAKQNA